MAVDAIPQWSTADKVTGFYGQSKFGVGLSSIGQYPIYMVCTGTKTSDGSLTADSDMQQVFSVDEAAALVGARSTSLQQVKAALVVPNVNVLVCPPAEAGGAVAAYIDVAFGGTWTVAGTPVFWVNGERLPVSVGSTDGTADAAQALELAAGENQYLPVTASNGAAVLTGTVAINGLSVAAVFATNTFTFIIDGTEYLVTFSTPSDESAVVTQINAVLLTAATASLSSHYLRITSASTGNTSSVKIKQGTLLAATIGFTEGQTNTGTSTTRLTVSSKGTQGNQYLLGWDLTDAPAGMTVTVTGGVALHSKLVPFTGGTGTESVANIIGILESEQVDYIASAQTDSTNAQLWRSHVESEMAPTIGHLESVFFGHIGTLSAAGAFAASTLNDEQSRVLWYENCETHPAAISANAAALVSAQVGANPNTIWAGQRLNAVAVQRYKTDQPGHTTLMAALNTGLTPLRNEDGYAVIERDCVTKCLTGATPNYNTYGWPHVDVPFRARKEAGAIWTARREGNGYCWRDPVAGEKTAGVGVETPLTLGTALTTRWKEMEADHWLQDVDANPIVVEYDATRNCLVFSAPTIVQAQNLQAGGTIRQTVAK